MIINLLPQARADYWYLIDFNYLRLIGCCLKPHLPLTASTTQLIDQNQYTISYDILFPNKQLYRSKRIDRNYNVQMMVTGILKTL